MASEAQARVYFAVSAAELSVGAVLLSRALLAVWRLPARRRAHPMTAASLLLLLGDVATVANFLPREIANASRGSLEGPSAWCTASALVTIASVVALDFGVLLVAVATCRSVSDPMHAGAAAPRVPWYRWWARLDARFCAAWTACGWAAGAAVGGFYLAIGRVGPFENIYCCTTRVDELAVLLPVLLVTAATGALTALFYRRAVLAVRAVEAARPGPPPPSSSAMTSVVSRSRPGGGGSPSASVNAGPGSPLRLLDPAGGSDAGQAHGRATCSKSARSGSRGAPRTPRMSSAVVRRGVTMVCVFYFCWGPVSLFAGLRGVGVALSPWFHIVAAWIIKLQPIADSLVVIRSLNHASGRTAPGGSGGGSSSAP